MESLRASQSLEEKKKEWRQKERDDRMAAKRRKEALKADGGEAMMCESKTTERERAREEAVEGSRRPSSLRGWATCSASASSGRGREGVGREGGQREAAAASRAA